MQCQEFAVLIKDLLNKGLDDCVVVVGEVQCSKRAFHHGRSTVRDRKSVV